MATSILPGWPWLGANAANNQHQTDGNTRKTASGCVKKPVSAASSSSSSQGHYERQDSKPVSLLSQLTNDIQKRLTRGKSTKPHPSVDLDLWYLLRPGTLVVWREELRIAHQESSGQLYVFNAAGAKRGVAGFTKRARRTLLPMAMYPLPEALRNIAAWPTGQYIEHQRQYYPVLTNAQGQQFVVEGGVAQLLPADQQQQVQGLVLSDHDRALLEVLLEELEGLEQQEAAEGQQLV
jgi:hypothetical protein